MDAACALATRTNTAQAFALADTGILCACQEDCTAGLPSPRHDRWVNPRGDDF